MNTPFPSLEARVRAQEHMQLILQARIEDVSQDITKQQAGYQSLEARFRAQEHMQTTLNARIEELSQDMTASFKQLADYQIQTEHKIDARFDKIEANMATKEDIAAMEGRMLDAFKQLLTTIDLRLPPSQG